MSGLNAALKNMVHREPIVLWSCAIGLTGASHVATDLLIKVE
jgi:hypothetical protein